MSVFSVNSEHQDIEALMGQVGAGLARWEGGREGVPHVSAPSLGDADLNQSVALLNTSWNIDGQAIVHSTRPRSGRYIIRFQQVVRRLTWWFTEPVLLQVRGFNGNVTRSVSALFRRQNQLTAQVEELTARVEALERQLAKERGA